MRWLISSLSDFLFAVFLYHAIGIKQAQLSRLTQVGNTLVNLSILYADKSSVVICFWQMWVEHDGTREVLYRTTFILQGGMNISSIIEKVGILSIQVDSDREVIDG